MCCINKLVILTTVWVPWLYKDGGYEMFTFGIIDKLHKATSEAAAQLILQPQYTDNSQNICEEPPAYIKSMEALNFEVHSQMFWGLSVYCGCKISWAAASQVALCN